MRNLHYSGDREFPSEIEERGKYPSTVATRRSRRIVYVWFEQRTLLSLQLDERLAETDRRPRMPRCCDRRLTYEVIFQFQRSRLPTPYLLKNTQSRSKRMKMSNLSKKIRQQREPAYLLFSYTVSREVTTYTLILHDKIRRA